ncbi:hypothetical protein ACFFLM_02690 [Deinococcus oregonensis]|uniref:Uncharacterized protein n=1 Tax=Deinococcus oregonensis TaxID=1805970 RepID=A0ABV6AVZ1_9DEIO
MPHTYWNAGAGELHQTVTLEPALQHERFFESVYGLAAEGFTPERRTFKNALLGAGLVVEHHTWLAEVPMTLQRVVFPPLAALARMLGFRVWKPEFTGSPASQPDSSSLR